MKIFNKYNFKLIDGTGSVIYDFQSAFKSSKLTSGEIDLGALVLFDSPEKVTRQGDNLFTLEPYRVNGILQSKTFQEYRDKVNTLETALRSATAILIEVPSGTKYTIPLLPVNTVNHHRMTITPKKGYTVKADIAFNNSSIITEYTPAPSSDLTTDYALWINSRQDLYTDSAGTTPVSADDDNVKHAGDQSSNNNNATENLRPPVYKTDIDGTPTIFFAGSSNNSSNGKFLTTGSDVGHVGTVHMVLKPIDPVTNKTKQMFILGSRSDPSTTNGAYEVMLKDAAAGSDGKVIVRDGYEVIIPYTVDEWMLLSFRVNPTDGLRVYKNGSLVGSDATVTSLLLPSTGMIIGKAHNASLGRNTYQGHLTDLVVYNDDLTDPEHANNEDYLASIHTGRITLV